MTDKVAYGGEIADKCRDCVENIDGWCAYWEIPLRTKNPISMEMEGCTHARKKGTFLKGLPFPDPLGILEDLTDGKVRDPLRDLIGGKP